MLKISKLSKLKALAPKLASFVDTSKSYTLQELQGTPGVYLFKVGQYFYVGQTRNLYSRLNWHYGNFLGKNTSGGGVGPKYWSCLGKARSSSLDFLAFVLETGVECHNTLMRGGLERMWILMIWKLLGPGPLMNVIYVPAKNHRKRPISLATRLERSARMSALITALHTNPEYKSKARATAKENWASVDSQRRAELNEETGRRSKALFQNPDYRRNKSIKTAQQWKANSKLLLANQARLKKMRESGWKPTPVVVMRVTLPSGKQFTVLKKDLPQALGIRNTAGNLSDWFRTNYVFRDWTFEVVGKVSGKLRNARDAEFNASLEAFKSEPLVVWIRSMSEKHRGFFRFKPYKLTTTDGSFRCMSQKAFLEARAQGLRPYKEYYPCLHAYLSDKHLLAKPVT